ncbi:MAG TPA: hypothetical protein VF635_17415 [Propionibacteriaceae bacterium]|jgi:hypothetical protein
MPIARLVVPALLVALAGCAQPSSSAPQQTAAAAATNVCTGATGCARVADVDIDGDRRADQVGVASSHLKDGGHITVRVRTASGLTMQTTGRNVHWFAKPYVAAAPLDGRAGAEIFVGDTMGAHYEQFRVVTYRGGRLVTLKAPPQVWTERGMRDATSRWGVDGSYSFNTGVYRRVSAEGVVTVALRTLQRNDSGRRHSGHETTYRWQDGAWAKVSSRKLNVADKAAFAVGGWHVPGVPRFV